MSVPDIEMYKITVRQHFICCMEAAQHSNALYQAFGCEKSE